MIPWQAVVCLLIGLLPLSFAQHGVFEPFLDPLTEPAHPSPRPVYNSGERRLGAMDAKEMAGGAGFGAPCSHDAQCAQGLVCTRSEQEASRCVCSPATPVYIQRAGVGMCVRAKSLYESCVSSAECSANNPNVQCIDFLCYCPLPFVLTEDHRCLPPPGSGSVAAVAMPAVFLGLVAALGAVYAYYRIYHDGTARPQPDVVAVEATLDVPPAAPPRVPEPRYIRRPGAMPAAPPCPTTAPEIPSSHGGDGTDYPKNPTPQSEPMPKSRTSDVLSIKGARSDHSTDQELKSPSPAEQLATDHGHTSAAGDCSPVAKSMAESLTSPPEPLQRDGPPLDPAEAQ